MFKLKIYLIIVTLHSLCGCSTYKNRIVGKWEQVIIYDEILSTDRVKMAELAEPTIICYLNSGEFSEDHGDYSEWGRYIIDSDTLKYLTNDSMYKIIKLKKEVMILQFINYTSDNYIHYRKVINSK